MCTQQPLTDGATACRRAPPRAPSWQSYREVSYALVPVPEIHEFLKTTAVIMSDDEHYNMSLQCEPRSAH